MPKIITWVDLQGRYRVTSPAYEDLANAFGFTVDDAINWVWTNIVRSELYGITFDHPFYLIEDTDQRARVAECCNQYFRYAGSPDDKGKYTAINGAWEMDLDGLPTVNMPKARGVHMDRIRSVRNAELAKLDLPFMLAVEAGDTSAQALIATQKQTLRDIPQTFDLTTRTAAQLMGKWPVELPSRTA